MTRRGSIFGLLSFAVLLAAVPGTFGQSRGAKPPGILLGVVIGPDDKPVAGATVTYQSSGGEAPHIVHTDARGHFSIPKLRVDNYDVRASGKGVFSEWEKNVFVKPGESRFVTLRMIYAKEVPKAYVATDTYH